MNIHANQVTLTPTEKALLDSFAQSADSLPGTRNIREARASGIAMLRNGLPTRRVEAWHYTDLRRLLSRVPQDAAKAAPALSPLLDGAAVLTVAGGKAGPSPVLDGMTVTPLARLLETGDGLPDTVPARDDVVAAINQAFVSDGYAIDIATNASAQGVVELQHLSAGGQTHSRFLVNAGAGCKATFVERQTGQGEALVSSVTELDVAEGAEIVWIILQDQDDATSHLGQFNAKLGQGSKLTLFVMNAGGKLVRQEIRVAASGENSTFTLRGVNLLAGQAHCDVTMLLDHDAPHTNSTEVIRNVVRDSAHGVFQGQIRVAREAQKTDAKMSCNTLLLSDDADFSAKPELEIFADDVACGHGATVTEIEPQHMFYLMARGVPEPQARALLVKAFVAEVIEELGHEGLIEALEARLDAWFAAHG